MIYNFIGVSIFLFICLTISTFIANYYQKKYFHQLKITNCYKNICDNYEKLYGINKN